MFDEGGIVVLTAFPVNPKAIVRSQYPLDAREERSQFFERTLVNDSCVLVNPEIRYGILFI